MNIFTVALILALWCAISIGVRPVYAYLDPGSGSFIFQIIIGVIVGAGFFIKTYWNKLRGLFAKSDEHDDTSD